MHGAPEGRLRPGADASLRIGCDVGRVHHAERGCERVAAGERLPALGRMTLGAIAAAREGFALGNELWGEASWRGQRNRTDGRLPRQRAKRCKPEKSECNDRDEELCQFRAVPEHANLRELLMAG